jgi:hypothetical protein
MFEILVNDDPAKNRGGLVRVFSNPKASASWSLTKVSDSE